MIKNRILFTILFLLPGILAAQNRSYTEDPFDELVKEKKEIFGSEKEEKYPVRMLFVDVEKWPGHLSWHAFWFIRGTDYPKFKQFRIFPFYNSIEAKSGKASLDSVFPFFSYRRVERDGLKEKTFLSPLFYSNNIEPVGGGIGYRESSKFYWLGYNSNSSGPGFEKNLFMFPGFLPLLILKSDLNNGIRSNSTMILPLLYFHKSSLEESDTWFTLLRWGHDQEKNFFNFFPIVYYTNYKIKEDYSFTFFPLYHQSRSTGLNSQRFSHYSPFLFWEKEKFLDSEWESSFLPFLLFYKSRRLVSGKETTRFLFAPLALYLKDNGENYKVRNFLVFQWGKENDWSYFRIFPFFYWSKTKDQSDSVLTFFPFWFYKTNSYFHIPILGFFHTSSDGQSETVAPFFYKYSTSYDEEFFLLGYHSRYISRPGSSNFSSFTRFYPFYYSSHEHDGSSFLGLAGLFYLWKNSKDETVTRTILPFHYYQKNEYNLLFPFYFRFGGDDFNYVSFSPFHYRFRSTNVDRDWVWLYYSSEDRKEKTSSLFVAPFYFEWKGSESKGDILLPAYLKYYEKNKNLELYFGGFSVSQTGGKFDASLKSSDTGKEYFIDFDYSFIYNLFSISLRKEVPNPLTFFTDEKEEDELNSMQVQNSKSNGVKKGFHIVEPNEKSQKLTSVENSNFASYKKLARETSKNYFGWEVLFGIVSYQSGDDKKHFRILPLTWFTWGTNSKDYIFALPLPPIFFGKVGNESYRVVFPFYAEQKKGTDFVLSLGIFLFLMEREKDRREYSVLWPLIRYTKSNEETSYRFFPIFTHRETAERLETKSIFYYRYKEKTGVYETSSFHGILFPFYQASEEILTKKDYSSGSGYNTLIPFYFRNYLDRFEGEKQIFKERNLYSFLFLYSYKEDLLLKQKESFFLSPFYYFSYEESDVSSISDLNLILPIPFLVWGRDKKGEDGDKRFRFILGYYNSSFFQRSVNATFRKSSWNFLLFTGGEKYINDSYSSLGTQETTRFYLFPFYFREEITEGGNWTYRSHKIPILYSSQTTPNSYNITILLFAGFKSDPESGIKRTMVLPFWYQSENRDKISGNDYKNFKTFTPVFFQTETSENWANGESSFKISKFYTVFPLPMLYTFESKIKRGPNTSRNLTIEDQWDFDWLLFINYRKENKTFFTVETQSVSENKTRIITETKSVSLNTLFYLYGYEKSEKFSNNTAVLERRIDTYFFPLFFYKSTDLEDHSSTYRWTVPILVYRSFQGNQDGAVVSHTNLLGILFDYQRDDVVKKNSVFFFPSIYYSNDQKNKEKTFFFLPIFYTHSYGDLESNFFILGYYQRRNERSNRYNFLYLFDLESYVSDQKKELSIFLGVFNAEFERDRTRWGVFGGILLGYESTPQMTDWNFLWIRYLNSPQEKIQNFLPIYRYGETQEGYSFLAPPILTYHSKDSEGSITLGGLGLIYYQNHSEVEKEESTKILGGLLYFSEKKALRGFQNYGVLGAPFIGGLLWNYELEEETGFQKMSFLKFVFSRTTYKGKTWNSYFGISPSLWFD
ncbi:LA_1737 family protein [Leptospira noguchii]|uniref:LA_1737 family protein n=1 Tax=Leptospira noguchii TaxID=28182 RepID=UPI000773FC3B|nr:hypothetical protein [Leptospira noguchii]UOG59244.1 hypothetical protein MAL07_10465 [Leptospira noguchii]